VTAPAPADLPGREPPGGRGQDGSPPYLVHWTAGDYDAQVTPDLGARIEKHR
jgi:hypothetical protein